MIIKRSQRLSWLSTQPDVGLRARAFFSPASCLHCLNTIKLPPTCNATAISAAALRNAIHGTRPVPLDSDLSFLANIVARRPAHLFYTMQCTNQCLGHDTTSATTMEECYCRACASLPEFGAFAAFCSRFTPPDVPECTQLAPFLATECHRSSVRSGGGRIGKGGDGHGGSAPESGSSRGSSSEGGLADERALDGHVASRCRTAFNTSCCPAPSAASAVHGHDTAMSTAMALPCGGRGRGVCVPIETWLAAQVDRGLLRQTDHESCWWPRSYGAARCLCEPQFAGSDCGGCARGLAGADCTAPRPPEARRSFRNVSYEEATHWASLIGRTLHAQPSAVAFAPENELEMVHEFNRHFHASNWLNHFHILYFEEWLEHVRRATGDYTTPYFYFDPSDAASLTALNAYMERAEREPHATQHSTRHAPHRGRRFTLAFPGNLPPPDVDRLVATFGNYFPYTSPYERSVFNQTSPTPISSSLAGTFSSYFQRLHAIHQMVLVGGGPIAGSGGPCIPAEKHGFPEKGALGCLPLGPSHAFYEWLLRRWMAAHGREAACNLVSDADAPPNACVPFLLPITRLRDLCDEKRLLWHAYVPSA